MTRASAVTLYCVPHCGHARSVLDLLRRRGLPFHQRTLTADAADEVMTAYHLYGSPVLVINGDVVTGPDAVRARIEQLASTR